MPRDDFPKNIVDSLARRVGYRCSRCRKPTSGPHTVGAKAVIVGVAAHITAASAGGPRYDVSLTPEARSDAANGIWLCETCGKLIDSDPTRFTVSLIRELKQTAEDAARAELEDFPSNSPDPVIQFAVDGWRIWRERGNLPDAPIVIVSIWGRGDIRYSCNVRLRNNGEHEEQIHNLRMQYRKETATIHEDYYAFQYERALPPRQWVTLVVGYGLHKSKERFFTEADSIWFAAELVGGMHAFAWKIADFDHTATLSSPTEP